LGWFELLSTKSRKGPKWAGLAATTTDDPLDLLAFLVGQTSE
jgi:hypothetical protein